MLELLKQVGRNCYFVEGETLCYIIPSYMYLFSSIGLIYFDLCTYIQAQLAHMMCYIIATYVNKNSVVE